MEIPSSGTAACSRSASRCRYIQHGMGSTESTQAASLAALKSSATLRKRSATGGKGVVGTEGGLLRARVERAMGGDVCVTDEELGKPFESEESVLSLSPPGLSVALPATANSISDAPTSLMFASSGLVLSSLLSLTSLGCFGTCLYISAIYFRSVTRRRKI
jgi:hypothetical protein